MKINSIFIFFICLLFFGCNPEPATFIYTFTVESPEAYKLTLTINHDKQYTIQEQYIYFKHKSGNYKTPKQKEGLITDEEFTEIKQILAKSNLFKMEDSYSFDQEAELTSNDVIYNITYLADKKEKHISIKVNDSEQFPLPFIRLIEYTDKLINKYKESN